jgi:hypothetical protein
MVVCVDVADNNQQKPPKSQTHVHVSQDGVFPEYFAVKQ